MDRKIRNWGRLIISKLIDLTGQRFGSLIVVKRVSNDKYNRSIWECFCDCGKTSIVSSGHLRSGHTSTCGRCGVNTYEIIGNITICKLASGHKIIIDTEDYSKVSKYTWCIDNHGYPKTTLGRGKNMKLHKLILHNNKKGMFVDHINGDRLDNRKENLRLATNQQNCCNSRINSLNTSGFKGVSFNKNKKKYVSYITCKQKRKHLGYYTNPVEAAIAYNNAASIYFGEFARLNFVPSSAAFGKEGENLE